MPKRIGYEAAVLALWVIAIVATILIADPSVTTYLLPVHFICMVGTVLVVKMAKGSES